MQRLTYHHVAEAIATADSDLDRERADAMLQACDSILPHQETARERIAILRNALARALGVETDPPSR
jgi:hypothetical protein